MTSCRGKLYVGTRKNRHNFTVCQCKCNKLLFERIYGKGYVFSFFTAKYKGSLLFLSILKTPLKTHQHGYERYTNSCITCESHKCYACRLVSFTEQNSVLCEFISIQKGKKEEFLSFYCFCTAGFYALIPPSLTLFFSGPV